MNLLHESYLSWLCYLVSRSNFSVPISEIKDVTVAKVIDPISTIRTIQFENELLLWLEKNRLISSGLVT